MKSEGRTGDTPCRAVIFDLFGTLVLPFSSESYAQSLAGMASAIGVEREAFRRLWEYESIDARMTGAFATVEANIAYIARRLGVAPSTSQLEEAVRIRLGFYRAGLKPRPDAVATLRGLKDLGLRLGLISDCSCEAPLLWPETPFAALIDEPTFSCTAGMRKPDPRLYRLTCERLRVAPEACFYVGDGYGHELSGARAVGLRAVLIAVPGEAPLDADNEGLTWDGPRIASLGEIMTMVVS